MYFLALELFITAVAWSKALKKSLFTCVVRSVLHGPAQTDKRRPMHVAVSDCLILALPVTCNTRPVADHIQLSQDFGFMTTLDYDQA